MATSIVILGQSMLNLEQCPHCKVRMPTLPLCGQAETKNHLGANRRLWGFYWCKSCGGMVTAGGTSWNQAIGEHYPNDGTSLDANIPQRAREYMQQAADTVHAASGCVMLCASAVDAMLKDKGYKEGSLYSRIDKAAKEHVLTEGMSKWAHAVRLDANDERHADESAALPSGEDAKRCLEFVRALSEFMYVLPARVDKGIRPSGNAR